MRNFFSRLWRVVVYPFRLTFQIVTFPFRAVKRFRAFINSEPEERPLTELFVDLATDGETRQMLWDQIEALRMHILRMLIGLSVAVIASFWLALPLMDVLAQPVGGVQDLQAIDPTEGIGVFMRVALMAGIAIASPYIAFEAWLFAAPGLKAREKKMGLLGIPLATIFFVLGLAFTFYILLPPAIPFLAGFTKIHQFWSAQRYFGLVTTLMLWIGFFFEFPLVIYVLTAIGLVKPKVLAEQWRVAIVIIAIIAAAITPTVDPVNQALAMAPMILLYFVSILLSYVADAGRRRRNSAAEKTQLETESNRGDA